jgi:hypothetical protein
VTRRKDVATLCASILVGFASVAGALVTLFGSGPAILLWVALPLVLALALVVEAGVISETPTDDSAPEVSE